MNTVYTIDFLKQVYNLLKNNPYLLFFEEVKLECGYRADIIIENKVIIEVKAVEALNDVHKAQVLTYLRLTGLKLGLLMNINTVYLKDGIKRIVNNL